MSRKESETSVSSMEQVRDLLMGTHIKEVENRFQRQEQLFLREIATLRENIQNSVNSLENFMKNEFASLSRRLEDEKSERTILIQNENKERLEAVRCEQEERVRLFEAEKQKREEGLNRVNQELLNKKVELERKIDSLSSLLDSEVAGIRNLILSENSRLLQTLEERHRKGMETLESTALHIRQDTVSRASLSSMFAEVAVRFSEDIQVMNENKDGDFELEKETGEQ